jgi:hypothetical protein
VELALGAYSTVNVAVNAVKLFQKKQKKMIAVAVAVVVVVKRNKLSLSSNRSLQAIGFLFRQCARQRLGEGLR